MNTKLESALVRTLWVSAGVMLGLILFRSEPLSGAPPFGEVQKAHAGTLGTAGSYTIMTSSANNEDLFLVLDARAEELLAYKTQNNGSPQLFDRILLAPKFTEARVLATGTAPSPTK